MARARRAQESGQCLTVGFMLGMDIASVMAEFARIHPGVEIQLQRLRWWNHAAALRDGRADAGFVRLPLPTEGLQVQALYQEPVCVALPAGHPLAGMASIGIAELVGEPVSSTPTPPRNGTPSVPSTRVRTAATLHPGPTSMTWKRSSLTCGRAAGWRTCRPRLPYPSPRPE